MLRILHLEDSAGDAKLIHATLKQGYADCEIKRVDTRDDFLAALKAFPAEVILADYQLPSFNGGQALDLARELRPETPFIFVTGALGEEIAIDTLKRGATDYVLKQKLSRLVPAVQRAVAEAEQRRERQRAQAEVEKLNRTLQQRIQELQALFDVAPIGIAVARDPECRDVYMNPAGAAMFGISATTPAGAAAEDVAQQIQKTSSTASPIARAAKLGEAIRDEECAVDRAGDAPLYLLQYATPLHDESKNVRGAVGIWVDVSAYKRSETELRHAREQAERLSRVKDEFLATLSHELRTPLTPVLGWLKMIKTGRLAEADLQRGISVVERNIQGLQALVEDLLDISRIIVGKIRLDMDRTDIRPVLEAAFEAARTIAEAKGVQLAMQIPAGPAFVIGDPSRLQQIVWNLLSNAVKFTPAGGRVTLSMKVDDVLIISVSDTGEGITAEYQPHVFERFSQADSSITRRYGGLGLGLAIVKHLTELHSGSVSVTSEGKGKGSCFTVRLPRAPLAVNSGRTTVSAQIIREARFPAGLRILVVDDELDTREFVTFALERSSAEVITASSAIEAMHLFAEFKPRVIVSDLSMPVNDGYSLLKSLREAHADIPVLALSAMARPEDKARALDAGFNYFLSKPVDPNELISVIAALSDREPLS